jgi:hypothetical protein
VKSVSLLSPQSENLLVLHLDQKSQVAFLDPNGKLDILREFSSTITPQLAHEHTGRYFLGLASPSDKVF